MRSKAKIDGLIFLCLGFSLGLGCVSNAKKETLAKDKSNLGLVINRGRYRIGSEVITDTDLKNMRYRLRRLGTKGNLKKKAVDALVERALIHLAAEKETILISDKRVNNEITNQRLQKGLSERAFRKQIEKQFSLPFSEWVNEVRYNLLKRQLVQVTMSVPSPQKSEVKKFYRKNRKRIGLEFNYREIILIPQNSSLKEERRISAIAKTIYQQLLYQPQQFAKIARTNPHNHSPLKSRGGLRVQHSIYDIARKNPVFASRLYGNPIGKISRPFRDSLNRYVIVKVERRRPLPLSKVRRMILGLIYAQKEKKVFAEWLTREKKKVVIVAL